jgi:hypothetical protein
VNRFTPSQRKTEVASIIDLDMKLGRRPIGAPTAARNVLPHCRTTRPERFLLLTTIIVLPLEFHIPTVAGFSSLFLMFAMLAGYVIVNRPHILDRIWRDPIFIAAFAFIGLSGLLEFASPLPSYEVIIRFGLMIFGAMLVASLCRDRLALGACLYGYIGAALWFGSVLVLTMYGTLHGVMATGFEEASQIRAQVAMDIPVRNNLNAMSFTCAQGGIVAFAFALTSSSAHRRTLFSVIAVFCLVASSLPMSRSGMAIGILSCAAILYAYGLRHGKALIVAAMLGTSIYLLVPDAIWSRMEFHTDRGAMETRAALFVTAVEHLPEYLFTGVGAGNFINKWGFENGFGTKTPGRYTHVIVVHNSFLQVMVNWGLAGLIPFIVMIWQAYRCVPKRCGRDALALSLLGIAVSLVLLMFVASEFYYKGFSLGLGMLVASRYWIWPSGIVQPVRH